MSANCDAIVNFPIYGQFGAIRKPYSRCIVCKTYTFIKNNLSSYKKCKQSQEISNTACTKNAYISKIKRDHVLKGIFSETTYAYVLTYQILISRLIITSFRQGEGEGIILPPSHPTLKCTLNSPLKLGINSATIQACSRYQKCWSVKLLTELEDIALVIDVLLVASVAISYRVVWVISMCRNAIACAAVR